MNFKMICISNHNIMLLATSLLRIYPNYVHYGMHEIDDCLYVIVLALFITPHTITLHFHYMLFFFHRGNIVYRHICLLIFPSITNCIMYFKMYADEM